jgi:CubicO group peptidase (beta-lactamase class C family)
MMDGRLALVADLVDSIVCEEDVQGAGVAVLSGGTVALEHYAGEAGPGTLAGPATLWPVASISKLYTATMLMRLVEQGELSLITRVGSVLPRFDGGGKERITLRQLLTHTSGLVYEPPEMARLLAEQTPLEAIVDEAYSLPLDYPPGTDQRYSDLGYAVAGRMAAVAMQGDFASLVWELVLEPAGLTSTFLPAPTAGSDRIAYVTGALGEGAAGAMYNSPYTRGLAHPAFGAVATLPDLLAFGALFLPGAPRSLLSGAGLATMTSDQTCGDEPGDRVIPPVGVIHPWGLGFMLKGRAATMELVSPTSFGHGGASGCILWVDPVHEVVVAFVSNRHVRADPDGFMPRLTRVVNATLAALTRT